ncbi:uncharacterized protein PAN0_016d5241 [Moesziomyces antarcticus]|uniref:Uncharacterized protein n=1 Tax=Pseudozyma antarctica TaxID=84753 RepID=A0A081CK19_PSEA2|nr:uncharacterized protein PAN0_016d5241 [Moesziomyces antarcticus]GAK67015.1 hypothetical protein PAN0_016d5241 [Moesziomyces antarcticus]
MEEGRADRQPAGQAQGGSGDRQWATAFFWRPAQACTVSHRQEGQAGFEVDTAVAVKAPVEIPQILGPKSTESDEFGAAAQSGIRSASMRIG